MPGDGLSLRYTGVCKPPLKGCGCRCGWYAVNAQNAASLSHIPGHMVCTPF